MKNELGKRYGRLVVTDITTHRKFGQIIWLCTCDCGGIKRVLSSYLRHGVTRSCGCLRNEDKRLGFGESAKRRLFCSYKNSARKRGHSWGISKREFFRLTKKNCHYCGVAPRQIYKPNSLSFGSFTYNGIDRVENLRGYCKGNVVTCCTVCNVAKGTMRKSDFLAWARRVYETSVA